MQTLRALEASDPTTLLRRRERLPDVISVAHVVTEEIEAFMEGASEGDPREATFKRLRRRTEEGLHVRSTYAALLELPRPAKHDLMQAVHRLPVHPAIALKVLRRAANEDVSFQTLAALASQDQTLSGHLIRAANSCLYGAAAQIATLSHAMSFIGLEETRRVLTAAALRPLYASAHTAQLWHHSLRVGRWCETVAAPAKDEAFLAGLVHDVGRLVTSIYSSDANATWTRLVERGCDGPFAEVLLFGCDHGALGADVLRYWNFPETLIEGITHHHRPERSRTGIASLLFLAETQFPEENTDPASESIRHALESAGLRSDVMNSFEVELGPLAALTVAA